jgi:hypothetical protein
LIISSCRNVREHGLFGRKSLDEAIEWAKQDSMRVADSLPEADGVKNQPTEAIQEPVMQPAEEGSLYEEIGKRYYIIIGSFSNNENALQVADHYRNMGYETSIIDRRNSSGNILFMVSIKTLNNIEEAERYKIIIQREVSSSAWLYESK